MNRFFYPNVVNEEEIITITGPDVSHIRQVLRLKEGDDIEVVDAEGMVSTCRLLHLEKDRVEAEILFSEAGGSELPGEVLLFQGYPKSDKIEWVLQKAVELGVHAVTPVITDRTVVRLSPEKAEARIKRLQTIAESAAKQSKRAKIPEVCPLSGFSEALERAKESDVILIPYEKAEGIAKTKETIASIRPGSSVSVFIGPEGGFTRDEIEEAERAGAVPITLGKRILRTETAAITILSLLMMQLSDG